MLFGKLFIVSIVLLAAVPAWGGYNPCPDNILLNSDGGVEYEQMPSGSYPILRVGDSWILAQTRLFLSEKQVTEITQTVSVPVSEAQYSERDLADGQSRLRNHVENLTDFALFHEAKRRPWPPQTFDRLMGFAGKYAPRSVYQATYVRVAQDTKGSLTSTLRITRCPHTGTLMATRDGLTYVPQHVWQGPTEEFLGGMLLRNTCTLGPVDFQGQGNTRYAGGENEDVGTYAIERCYNRAAFGEQLLHLNILLSQDQLPDLFIAEGAPPVAPTERLDFSLCGRTLNTFGDDTSERLYAPLTFRVYDSRKFLNDYSLEKGQAIPRNGVNWRALSTNQLRFAEVTDLLVEQQRWTPAQLQAYQRRFEWVRTRPPGY